MIAKARRKCAQTAVLTEVNSDREVVRKVGLTREERLARRAKALVNRRAILATAKTRLTETEVAYHELLTSGRTDESFRLELSVARRRFLKAFNQLCKLNGGDVL